MQINIDKYNSLQQPAPMENVRPNLVSLTTKLQNEVIYTEVHFFISNQGQAQAQKLP